MAPELRPYDVNTPCPACGKDGAKTEYKARVGAFDPKLGRSRGVMLRECPNCGCKWRELPLGEPTDHAA